MKTAPSSLQLGFEALDGAARPVSRQVVIERLAPLARELAKVRGTGITVGELRHEAQKRGLLPRESKGREFSFLGAVMKAAKLVATEDFRRSDIPQSHGNPHRVWILAA